MHQLHFHRRTLNSVFLDRKTAVRIAVGAAAAGPGCTGLAAGLGRTALAARGLACIAPAAVPECTALAAALGHTVLALAAEPGYTELVLVAVPEYIELELAVGHTELELAAEPVRTEFGPVVERTAFEAECIEPAAEPEHTEIELEAAYIGPAEPVGHIELATGLSALAAERLDIAPEVVLAYIELLVRTVVLE
jgi:hypothetical protein